MNVALIIAGGRGLRTQQDIPKQFLTVFDRPILFYTLETFQQHPDIDMIGVVCLEGWEEIFCAYTKQFQIDKVKAVFKSGETVQESIRNGVLGLKEYCKEDDIIIIHDGIRPMVDASLISDCIVTCRKYGNGVSAMPYFEQIFLKKDDLSTTQYVPRDTIMCVQTPQAYRFHKLYWAYQKAFEEKIGISYSAYTNTMMVDLGETLYFSAGSSKNLKITTSDDIEILKSIIGDTRK